MLDRIAGTGVLIPPDFAYSFAGIASFRNFLAHDYDRYVAGSKDLPSIHSCGDESVRRASGAWRLPTLNASMSFAGSVICAEDFLPMHQSFCAWDREPAWI